MPAFAVLFLAAVGLLATPGHARVSGANEKYCRSLNATPQGEADCAQLSSLCDMNMASRLSDVCGERGSVESGIQTDYNRTISQIRDNPSAAQDGATAAQGCGRVTALRNDQVTHCGNLVRLCTTGNNPAPRDGEPEVFKALIATKAGRQIEVNCGHFPQSVCERIGSHNLNNRIRPLIAQEQTTCNAAIANANSAGQKGFRVPTSEPKGKPAYTADEIICHFAPESEGCPK